MKSIITEKLLELDAISNPPFNTYAIQKHLKKEVENFGYSLVLNKYYSYIHVNSNPKATKLILFCHTDHPAFIFKDSNSGVLFGKFDIDQVVKNVPFEIDVFNNEGIKVFTERIVSMNGRNFVTTKNHKAKPNYSARFSIKEKQPEGDKLGLYSADNYLGTFALLSLLQNKQLTSSQYNIYFVFNHYEEIFQLGSMKFAQENILGISDNDILINIDTWREGSNDEILLQLLEKGCVYSLWSNKNNTAEYLAKKAAKNINIAFEMGKNTGSGDARILDHYQLTPNLISLGIPRDKYHNISIDGKIGYEILSLKKYTTLINWLEAICLTDLDETNSDIEISNRDNLKDFNDSEFLKKSWDANITYFEKYRNSVERGYFFHQNLLEKIIYWLRNKIQIKR